MVKPEKIQWSIQKKFHGRSQKNPWSLQKQFNGRSRKNSMVDPEKNTWSIQRSRKKSMVNPEKNQWSIQKKFNGRSRKKIQWSIQKKNPWSFQKKITGRSRKNSMVDSEKISWLIQKKIHGRSRKNLMVDPEKIPWQIQKKLHHGSRSSLELCNPWLCLTFHLPSYFTWASKMAYRIFVKNQCDEQVRHEHKVLYLYCRKYFHFLRRDQERGERRYGAWV